MLVRLMILCFCMPLYSQQVTTTKVIRNTEIVNQLKGFSDGLLRTWKESARNTQQYIQQHPVVQFAREFYTLQVCSILEQLEWLGTCAVADHTDRGLMIKCTHDSRLQQEVDTLLKSSSFIMDLDTPDQERPDEGSKRQQYDMQEVGGTVWHKLEDDKVIRMNGTQKGEQDDELTALWLHHTQTQDDDL